MAADLERLAEQFAGKFPQIAELLRVDAVAARKLGVPEFLDLFAKVYPGISLPKEHQRQGLVLAGCFAARLGLSQEAYIATLPEFPELPLTYDRLGLTVPVIVETRVPWLEAAELSGIYITNYMREQASVGGVKDWKGINFDMPGVPFTTWVFEDEPKFISRDPKLVREELGEEENRKYVAGSILPVISIYDVRPDMCRAIRWNIIGTVVGPYVPFLGYEYNRPVLSVNVISYEDFPCRALVFGREIRTLNLVA